MAAIDYARIGMAEKESLSSKLIKLSKTEKKVNILELRESRRLVAELTANSKRGIDPCDIAAAAEVDDNDLAVLTV